MRSKEVDEAIDTLQNCIADYVIGDFCVGKYCPMENECKDKDCPFNDAIDKVVAYISELENMLSNRIAYTQVLEKDLFENCENYVVNKDKIRDKIKELEEEKGNYFSQCFIEERENKIQVLKELLEGE